MKRKIKLRGQLKLKDEWVYGFQVYTKDDASDSSLDGNWVKTESLGQFTGFFDSALKEIYEDDIISIDGILYVVLWSDCFGAFVVSELYSNAQHLILGTLDKSTAFIVGNIHENTDIITSDAED